MLPTIVGGRTSNYLLVVLLFAFAMKSLLPPVNSKHHEANVQNHLQGLQAASLLTDGGYISSTSRAQTSDRKIWHQVELGAQ
jgi:hypothetical protein